MPTIQSILRQINKEVVPLFETRLREHLDTQDRAWLIEQVVRLTLDAHSLQEMDRKQLQEAKARKRAERVGRLRGTVLDREALLAFLDQDAAYDRERLMRQRHQIGRAPG